MDAPRPRCPSTHSVYSESEIEPPVRGFTAPIPFKPTVTSISEEHLSSDDESPSFKPPSKISLLKQFLLHQSKAGFHEHDTVEQYNERKRKLKSFTHIPFHLERFILFGLLICLDVFLYMFTILPLRIFTWCFSFLPFKVPFVRSSESYSHDITAGLLFLVGSLTALSWDISSVYHAVRGQNLLKLYSIYQLIEIVDKLLGALGQDAVDNVLFSQKVFQKGLFNLIYKKAADLLFSLVYIVLHVTCLLFQLITFNVAINSKSYSIVALLISNNFTELKGAVFKKYTKIPLFQIAFTDITERFHLLTLTILTGIQSFIDMKGSTSGNFDVDLFRQLLSTISVLLGSELIVDWAKHSFICYFNNHSSKLYPKYLKILLSDIFYSFNGFNSNPNNPKKRPSVARRIGFVPLPLACVTVRVLIDAFTGEVVKFKAFYLVMAFALAFAVKFVISALLIFISCKSSGARLDLDLHKVERYLLLEKRVP
ncbi:hypothetical protein P9112_003918 [Eukaryota sp. TZLM1-RC]